MRFSFEFGHTYDLESGIQFDFLEDLDNREPSYISGNFAVVYHLGAFHLLDVDHHPYDGSLYQEIAVIYPHQVNRLYRQMKEAEVNLDGDFQEYGISLKRVGDHYSDHLNIKGLNGVPLRIYLNELGSFIKLLEELNGVIQWEMS